VDENPYQRWYGETHLHPLAIVAIAVLGIAMLCVPRRHAVIPMLLMACFVSPAQQVAVFSLNFDLLRIMVLFGSARVLFRGEWRGFVWTPLDWAILAWGICGTAIYSFHYGTLAAVKFKMGVCYDAFGMYFLFRIIIRNLRDWAAAVKAASVIAVPVAIAFVVERLTAHNMFAIFGGVREITWVREGRLRCQGAFAHAILAGCFFAGLLPLMVAQLWTRGGSRLWGVVGSLSAVIVIITCASSTPISAVAVSVVAAAAFPFRRYVGHIKWAGPLLILALHLSMNKPVWHLLGRFDLAGGSTGYHRYRLVDAAVNNFGEWWLHGTSSTMHWGPQLNDVTNQYILEGVRGGVATMVLFIVMIGVAFRSIGKIVKAWSPDTGRMAMGWALGVALCGHCASFIAISYFGQVELVWYLLLGAIGSLSVAAAEERKKARAWAAADSPLPAQRQPFTPPYDRPVPTRVTA
jgi:hypothetical protein